MRHHFQQPRKVFVNYPSFINQAVLFVMIDGVVDKKVRQMKRVTNMLPILLLSIGITLHESKGVYPATICVFSVKTSNPLLLFANHSYYDKGVLIKTPEEFHFCQMAD